MIRRWREWRQSKRALRRIARQIALRPVFCRRCGNSQSFAHRPCYAVGCQCRCSS